MSDAKMKTYEGMFLLEAGNSDFQAASEPVRAVLDREAAEILAIKPWDERRLAYDIRGHKRALYVLTYFRLDPSRVGQVEHECDLNERILRVLILRKDHLGEEEIIAETPAMASARRAAEEAEKAPPPPPDEQPAAAEAEEPEKAPPPPPDEQPAAEAPGEQVEPDEADKDKPDEDDKPEAS